MLERPRNKVSSCAQLVTQAHDDDVSHITSPRKRARGAIKPFPIIPNNRLPAFTPDKLLGSATFFASWGNGWIPKRKVADNAGILDQAPVRLLGNLPVRSCMSEGNGVGRHQSLGEGSNKISSSKKTDPCERSPTNSAHSNVLQRVYTLTFRRAMKKRCRQSLI